MRLVEDHGVVLREDGRAVGPCPQRQVREVEGVVGDDEIGLPRPLTRLLGVAATDQRAATACAALGSDGELRPERLRRLEVELGAVAGLRRLDPVTEPLEVGRVLGRAEKTAELVDPLKVLAAEIVLPPFDDGDPDAASQGGGRGRHVLRQELLLERLRRRRHHDALAGEKGRQEVGQALSGARPRLCNEVVAAPERLGDFGGERLLLDARLEAGKSLGKAAGGSKVGIHGGRRA